MRFLASEYNGFMDIIRPQPKRIIPPSAKMVFAGKIFAVYQWEQDLYDGSKTIFENLKRPDTVSVIPVTEEGKIVICEQEQPGLEPFVGVLGGRVDPGEGPLEAAKRELLEESGLQAEEFSVWFSFQPIEKIDWAIFSFIAKGCKKVKEPELEGGEKIKLLEVSFEEFVAAALKKDFRDQEISFRILKAQQSPEEWEEEKKLLGIK